MISRALTVLLAGTATMAVSGCGGSDSAGPVAPPSVHLNAIVGGGLDPAFVAAWNQAAVQPQDGLGYPLSASSTGLPEGTTVALTMARYTGLYANGVPVTSGEYPIATSSTETNGSAAFPHLAVATGQWNAGTDSIPVSLLCGETLVMARALDAWDRILALTYFFVATAPCP